jgi:hypothetical protein
MRRLAFLVLALPSLVVAGSGDNITAKHEPGWCSVFGNVCERWMVSVLASRLSRAKCHYSIIMYGDF